MSARRDPAPGSRRRAAGCSPVASRLTARTIRGDDAWGWVYIVAARPLSRPPRGHRAVDRRAPRPPGRWRPVRRRPAPRPDLADVQAARTERARLDLRRARRGRAGSTLDRGRGDARLDARRPRRPPRGLVRRGRPGHRGHPRAPDWLADPDGGHRRLERAEVERVATGGAGGHARAVRAARAGDCSTRSPTLTLDASCARPDGWSWAYDCLHGHVRKHLAMIGPWCVAAGWPEPDGRRPRPAPATSPTGLTIEAIVAVESPREFRVHPRDRLVAYTAERPARASCSRCRCVAGTPTQLTASEKAVARPAVVARRPAPGLRPRRRDLGRRGRRLAPHPGASPSRAWREPRWSPDGRRLAFLSRRRGWSQVWLIDAPVPRRGRPATRPEAAGGRRP